MIIRLFLAALALVCAASFAQARQRVYLAHPDCNIVFPCEGVSASPRGEMIAKAVGFGVAQKIYTPRAVEKRASQQKRVFSEKSERVGSTIVAHPPGCPSRAFCGCGAAVRVFGSPIRSLWLAANWFRFPRTPPAPGMVAVRRHHVFVLEADLGGGLWQVFDANSGGHATRIHARSIAGYVIVNPRA